MKQNKHGLILCAGGKNQYINEARYAAKTFKRFNPTIPVTLFTDQNITAHGEFDRIIIETGLGHPQKLKMHGMLHTPYERTLYLDSDTRTCGSLAELFAVLDFYNIGFTHRIKCKWPPIQLPFSSTTSTIIVCKAGCYSSKSRNPPPHSSKCGKTYSIKLQMNSYNQEPNMEIKLY